MSAPDLNVDGDGVTQHGVEASDLGYVDVRRVTVRGCRGYGLRAVDCGVLRYSDPNFLDNGAGNFNSDECSRLIPPS